MLIFDTRTLKLLFFSLNKLRNVCQLRFLTGIFHSSRFNERQQMGHNRSADEFIDVCSTLAENKQHLKWFTGCCGVLFFPLIPASLCVYLSQLSNRTVFSFQITDRKRERKQRQRKKMRWKHCVCVCVCICVYVCVFLQEGFQFNLF